MKIAFLTKRTDACFWLRIMNPMSHLVSRGHDCSDDVFEKALFCESCARQGRPYGPYEHQWDHSGSIRCPVCRSEIMSEHDVLNWRTKIKRQIDNADVVVFQRPTDPAHLRLMHYAKSKGKKVVQTCDDNYLEVPYWNSGYQYYSQRQDTIKETLRISDAIDVTTQSLKDLYSAYARSEILPNSIDLEILDATPPISSFDLFRFNRKTSSTDRIPADQYESMRKEKKVILWGGSPTHEKDLELIVGAVRRIARSENVLFVFAGYIHRAIIDAIPEDRLALVGIVPATEYYALYKRIAADIGLAPVVDVPFNRGKSNLKAIEYAAMKTVPVMSDIITYRGAAPMGIYTTNDERGWYNAIRKAIHLSSEELAQTLDENRKFCEQNYDIKQNVQMWESFYDSL